MSEKFSSGTKNSNKHKEQLLKKRQDDAYHGVKGVLEIDNSIQYLKYFIYLM